jgi:hypothetical protein
MVSSEPRLLFGPSGGGASVSGIADDMESKLYFHNASFSRSRFGHRLL